MVSTIYVYGGGWSTDLAPLTNRDNASPKVQGISCTIFARIESLEVGEEKVRKAIERGEATQA